MKAICIQSCRVPLDAGRSQDFALGDIVDLAEDLLRRYPHLFDPEAELSPMTAKEQE